MGFLQIDSQITQFQLQIGGGGLRMGGLKADWHYYSSLDHNCMYWRREGKKIPLASNCRIAVIQ